MVPVSRDKVWFGLVDNKSALIWKESVGISYVCSTKNMTGNHGKSWLTVPPKVGSTKGKVVS